MNIFSHKTVVVTGAGSGMGREYALAFAKLGAKLALNDFDRQGLDETVALLKRRFAHIPVYAQTFDVADRQAMLTFADNVVSQLGDVFVVINNAGISGKNKPVWHLAETDYQRIMNINFYGVVNGTQAFLPMMLNKGRGFIVNVSSVFGLVGVPNAADYCASKFAVRGFTEALMVELEGTGISVHLVHPGGVKTNIANNADHSNDFANKFLKTSPTAVVTYVIKQMLAGKPRIVFGSQSFKIWLSSWSLPLKKRNQLLYQEMKELLDDKDYAILHRD